MLRAQAEAEARAKTEAEPNPPAHDPRHRPYSAAGEHPQGDQRTEQDRGDHPGTQPSRLAHREGSPRHGSHPASQSAASEARFAAADFGAPRAATDQEPPRRRQAPEHPMTDHSASRTVGDQAVADRAVTDRSGTDRSVTDRSVADQPSRSRRRPVGTDPDAVLTAVRELPGVQDAEFIHEPGREQVLRLDLVASVDPNVVGRQAAELLRDQLGLHAAVKARTRESALERRRSKDHVAGSTAEQGSSRGRRRGTPTPSDSGPSVTVEQVQVMTAGLEAAVEVGLAVSGVRVAGRASGPAHDWHVLRAAVTAATEALGMLLAGRARVAVEYAELVPAGPAKVAVVSLLLVSGAGTERLAGAAPVHGEAPAAAVHATISAVRHRLSDLLDGLTPGAQSSG